MNRSMLAAGCLAAILGCGEKSAPGPSIVGDARTDPGLLLLQQEKPAEKSLFQPFTRGPGIKSVPHGQPGSPVQPNSPFKKESGFKPLLPTPPQANPPKVVQPFKPGPPVQCVPRKPAQPPKPLQPRTPPKPPPPPQPE